MYNLSVMEREKKFSNLYTYYKLLSSVELSHKHIFEEGRIKHSPKVFKEVLDILSMAIYATLKGPGIINMTALYKGSNYQLISIFHDGYEVPMLVTLNTSGTSLLLFYDLDCTEENKIAFLECPIVNCTTYDELAKHLKEFLTPLVSEEDRARKSAKEVSTLSSRFNEYVSVSEHVIEEFMKLKGETVKINRNFQPVMSKDRNILGSKDGVLNLYDISEIIDAEIKLVIAEKSDSDFFAIHTLDEGHVSVNNTLYAECAFNGELLYGESSLSNLDIKAKKLGRGAKRIPVAILDKMSDYISKFRGLYRSYKQSRDDKLREQLINDEIIPFFDEIFEWLATVCVTYGTYSLAVINPVMSLVAGFLTKMVLNKRTKDRKKLALMFLKREIAIVDEKIDDAKSANNTQAKYALMRIKGELEKKLEEIRFDNRLS